MGDVAGFDPETVEIRTATATEVDECAAILDGAMLQADRERLQARVSEDCVLVASRLDGDSGVILGTLVLDDSEITAVAVRPGRRGRGLGRALVAAAASRRKSLWAAFDPNVRGFYDSLGFDIEASDESGRLRGTLAAEPAEKLVEDSLDGGLAGVE